MDCGTTKSKRERAPQIAIVGAGLGGITAAIQLKKTLPFAHFTIFERAAAVGGTWRDNTYPGCGSDVPGHWYSLSTDLNPNWTSYYVEQPELRMYWENLWHKHGLMKHTRLNTAIRGAEWDVGAQRYHLVVEDMETGERGEEDAEVVICAVGGFQDPKYPKDVGGVDVFRGELFHSARWRHDLSLKGKSVAVIGNGCSAAQFIPQISVDPSVKVINLCRTPQWYLQRIDFKYQGWMKWIFAHVPFTMRIYRIFLMVRSDIKFLIFRKSNKLLGKATRMAMTSYIQSKAPKNQLHQLIPAYAPGCKRIIVDPGYLDALHRPNVNLRWDPIERVVAEGILMKCGEIVVVDVIIFGTGYSLESADMNVRGSNGRTIQEYFEKEGGAMAYAGTCIPGFPNLFTILGPNVASGHASVIFSEEAQINMMLKLIKPVMDGKAQSFEVTTEATNAYNNWIQRRLADSVWTECNSYYQTGGNRHTKNIVTFPGPVALFWWITRRVRWEMFKAVGAEAWERERRRERMHNLVAVIGLLIALVLALTLQYFVQGQLPRG